MIVLTQTTMSIREVDIITVDVENPENKSEEQPWVLVGFDSARNDAAMILGTFKDKQAAQKALVNVHKQLSKRGTAKVPAA